MRNQDEIAVIEARIGSDAAFAERMHGDAIATLEAEGFAGTAGELRQLSEPLERLFRRAETDDRWAAEFQVSYQRDPTESLVAAGVERGLASALVREGEPEVEGYTANYVGLSGGLGGSIVSGGTVISGAGQSFLVYNYFLRYTQ
jgi:hypothetical protein